MIDIFLKTLPFFALIATGWLAGRLRFFTAEATAWLTRFVFYFALSAMLFRFAGTLQLAELFDGRFVLAYVLGSLAVWAVAMAVARARKLALTDCAMEAHVAMTGNTGFLGVPMLVVLLGERAIGPVLMVLTIDMILFSTLFTLIVTGARQGRLSLSVIAPLIRGVLANPMIVSMLLGLIWSSAGVPMWGPLDAYLAMLGAAATPGALFAIGASLALHRAERPGPAIWLSLCKLTLHPAAVGIAALAVFAVESFAAGVMICAAALPVAGNVYILAQHFGIAVQRVSSAILISTAASILTVPLVIHWLMQGK